MAQGILEMLRSSPAARLKRQASQTSQTSQTSHTSTKGSPLKKKANMEVTPDDSSDFSSDDDDDPLAQLLGKSAKTMDTLVKKRPSLFEDRNGHKVFKAPSPIKPPGFFSLSSLEVLKKSEELSRAHKEDDDKAMAFVREEEDFDKMLQDSLDKFAFNNKVYVNYLKLHRTELKLKDYYFFGTPKKEGRPTKRQQYDLPDVLFAIPGIIPTSAYKFDVLTEMDILKIERETGELTAGEVDLQYLKNFTARIGGISEAQPITLEDMKMDRRQGLPTVQMTMARLHYLITELSLSPYDQKVTEQAVRLLGCAMLDTRVFKTNCTKVIGSMISRLTSYIRESTDKEPYTLIINTWKSLTTIRSLHQRILESIPQVGDMEIITLRRLFSISLISKTPSSEKTSLTNTELDTMIYSSILQTLDELLQSEQVLEDEDYVIWMNNFKCILCGIKHGDQNPTLKEVGQALDLLKDAITISFQNQSQALCRSVMMLVAMLLDDKEVRMRAVLD